MTDESLRGDLLNYPSAKGFTEGDRFWEVKGKVAIAIPVSLDF